MTIEMILGLIIAMSPVFNLDPKVAVAVAQTESSLNPNATGTAGEIGLFQIMPGVAKRKGFVTKNLYNPGLNILLGLEMLQYAKEHCVHKADNDWLVCYNYGLKNAYKVKHPRLFPYVKRINKLLRSNHEVKRPD